MYNSVDSVVLWWEFWQILTNNKRIIFYVNKHSDKFIPLINKYKELLPITIFRSLYWQSILYENPFEYMCNIIIEIIFHCYWKDMRTIIFTSANIINCTRNALLVVIPKTIKKYWYRIINYWYKSGPIGKIYSNNQSIQLGECV